MQSDHLGFARMCRACKLEGDGLRDIFNAFGEAVPENPRIDEMLMACTSVQVSRDDGLPQLICNGCIEKLNFSYTFKQQCEIVDSTLRQCVEIYKKQFDVDYETKLLDDLEDMIDCKTNTKEIVKAETNETGEMKSDFIQIQDDQIILTCRECLKVYTTIDGLKAHKKVHVTCELYKCKTCDKEYSRITNLRRHEMTHVIGKTYLCKICNKSLKRYQHLRRHLTTHLKEKPFLCTKCSRGFYRLEHLESHIDGCKGDRVHICDICNRGFNRADSLEIHKLIHENKLPVLPTLENLDNINEHYIIINGDGHELPVDNVNEDDCDDQTDNEEVAPKQNDCLEPQVDITETAFINANLELAPEVIRIENELVPAEEPFTERIIEISPELPAEDNVDSESVDSDYNPTKLRQRKIKRGRGRPRKYAKRGRPPKKIRSEEVDEDEEVNISCPVCNEQFNRNSLLEKHAIIHPDAKVFKCSSCDKAFTRYCHLKRHLMSHSESKPFCCKLCDKAFKRSDHLTKHIQKIHVEDGMKFECDKCDILFNRSDYLRKHKFHAHNEGMKMRQEKKFICPICKKGFTTERYRDVHMKCHSGEKSYICKICQKSFLSKSHLTEHMKFHSDKSKKFLCSECGQRFIRNDYLIVHMRRHRGEKPFKCKYCGKGFPRTTDLNVHERYHTGEKTHLCVKCGRGFGRAYNLTVHMRTHTGEKPYRCSHCNAAFAQGNDLKAHIRRHTGERFQCDLCPDFFLMGYLLTQHKRNAHGLNVVSNIRRLNTTDKSNEDDTPPIEIALPPPTVPSSLLSLQGEMVLPHM